MKAAKTFDLTSTTTSILGIDVRVVSSTFSGNGKYMTLNAGGMEILVGQHFTNESITVRVNNASAKAWRGAGRTFFGGWKEVMAAYKSKKAQAALTYAMTMIYSVSAN